MKRTIKILASAVTSLVVLLICSPAFAQAVESAEAIKNKGLAQNFGQIALGAGLGIGLAALGGGIG